MDKEYVASVVKDRVRYALAVDTIDDAAVFEAFGVSDETKKALVRGASAVTGATLAGLWASAGTAATTASFKSLLLAAGFLNPTTAAVAATIGATAIAAATVYAGGKLAYNLSKDVQRGVYAPPPSKRVYLDIVDVVKKRDAAIFAGNEKQADKYTLQIQELSKTLAKVAYEDMSRDLIDHAVYKVYMQVSAKGIQGKLSAMV